MTLTLESAPVFIAARTFDAEEAGAWLRLLETAQLRVGTRAALDWLEARMTRADEKTHGLYLMHHAAVGDAYMPFAWRIANIDHEVNEQNRANDRERKRRERAAEARKQRRNQSTHDDKSND